MGNGMKTAWRIGPLVLLGVATCGLLSPPGASAYPPAVGILGKARNCVTCHADDGPWKDDEGIILDLLDKETGESLRREDGSFLISVRLEEKRTVLIVVGRAKGDAAPVPHRNGWIFVDPTLIARSDLRPAFPGGWEADLVMGCRVVGDSHKAYEGAKISVLPMTLRPTGSAKGAELEWQVLMTAGECVKGDASRGLTQNYFVRTVRFEVEE